MTSEPQFRTEGLPDSKQWWVVSRNHRAVAKCYSKRMARRVARLLNEDAARIEAETQSVKRWRAS